MPSSGKPEPAPSLSVEGVVVEAGRGAPPILALDALRLAPGARLALTGPSGAGKTTLLHVLAGILRPARGSVRWGGTDLIASTEVARDRFRRERIGLVFQDFHLIPELSALDNVLLPQTFSRVRAGAEATRRGLDLLERLAIPDPRRRANLLSRGERQRVALARALLPDPPILIADEPTASLDPAAGDAIGALLVEAAAERGATLIVATHDPGLVRRLGSELRVEAGRVREAA